MTSISTHRYSAYYKAYHNQHLTYEDLLFCQWIDKVEDIVLENTKFYLLDLDDEMYMVNFEAKMPAEEMAHIVVNNFNAYCDFLFTFQNVE